MRDDASLNTLHHERPDCPRGARPFCISGSTGALGRNAVRVSAEPVQLAASTAPKAGDELFTGGPMRLTIRVLGLDLLDVELTTEQQQDEDLARDLSGGTLASDRIEAGPTDRYMGFTCGLEVE